MKKLNIALVAMFAFAASQRISSGDDDDDDAFGEMVDTLNIFMYLFAGGPEEVVIRIGVLVIATLLSLAVAATIDICCKKVPRPPRWVENTARGASFALNASEMYSNRYKWC
jgi:hypothetical protein